MHAHTCVDKHNHVNYASIREACGCLEFLAWHSVKNHFCQIKSSQMMDGALYEGV